MGETYAENSTYTRKIGFPGRELPGFRLPRREETADRSGFGESDRDCGNQEPRKMLPPAKKAISASSHMTYGSEMELPPDKMEARKKAASIILNRISGSYEFAFKTFSDEECENSSEAQFFLGIMYLYGYGTEKNDSKAFEHMEKSYELGNPNSAYYLGLMYLNGIGTFKVAFKAMALFKEAAHNNENDHRAQLQIGLMYLEGVGTVENPENAFKWIKRAAENTDAEAQFILGQLYRVGYGCKKDPGSMKNWLELAAARGHLGANTLLGNIYTNGDGVRANKERGQ